MESGFTTPGGLALARGTLEATARPLAGSMSGGLVDPSFTAPGGLALISGKFEAGRPLAGPVSRNRETGFHCSWGPPTVSSFTWCIFGV